MHGTVCECLFVFHMELCDVCMVRQQQQQWRQCTVFYLTFNVINICLPLVLSQTYYVKMCNTECCEVVLCVPIYFVHECGGVAFCCCHSIQPIIQMCAYTNVVVIALTQCTLIPSSLSHIAFTLVYLPFKHPSTLYSHPHLLFLSLTLELQRYFYLLRSTIRLPEIDVNQTECTCLFIQVWMCVLWMFCCYFCLSLG